MDTTLAMPGAEGALGGSNMAPFLTKLFQIVSNTSTDTAIVWTPKGDSFVITDPDTFARDILPTYFKHNNIRSFIRQLNTYGFRKRTNISSSDEHLEFFHEKFRRDEPGLLTQIKRCHQPKPSASSQGGVDMVMGDAKAPQDLDTIRGRVSELKSRLGTLQAEIRDYNQQMEQKVNILMHILQTSTAPASSAQVPQPATSQALLNPLSSQLGSAGSLLQARRDALLGSLAQQPSGLNNMVGGLGMGALGGMGGALGGGLSGLSGLMGGQSKNGGAPGENGVAGLQHLLEAAQRYHGDDSSQQGGPGVNARALAGQEMPPAKRLCVESGAADAPQMQA